MAKKQRNPQVSQWLVGRRVRKAFLTEDGSVAMFEGGVISVDHHPSPAWHRGPPQPLFRVKYSDGDAEDLFMKDLLKIIVPPAPRGMCLGAAGQYA